MSIGADNFFYDRLSRLKEATVNRHPHDTFANGPQPAGSVTLDYAYDGFGNITDRRLTAMTNYTVGVWRSGGGVGPSRKGVHRGGEEPRSRPLAARAPSE